MSKTKLSPVQVKALRALAEEGNYAHYMPYQGRFNPSAYWFLHSDMSNVRCSTMDKLYQMGFVSGNTATITPAGRDYLRGLDEPCGHFVRPLADPNSYEGGER